MDLKVGKEVVFVDSVGKQFPALITAIHGRPEDVPCVNVVFISGDETRQDSYGRQVERSTSVVHRSKQPAHGFYYMEPGDTPNPIAPVQN